MKKITALSICIMLVITSISFIASAETKNTFEKRDLPFDVRLDIRITTKNNAIIPFYSHGGILPILLFNHLDIISFSLYEKTDDLEHLFASMKVNKFKFSEYRSVYVIYWTHDGIDYYASTYLHSLGDYVIQFCGYWEEGHTIYHHTIVEGDILENENKITWKIPKDLIGNPDVGESLTNIHAATYLVYQKDCGAPRQLRLASDYLRPLFGEGYTYSIQY